jgi:hypothetical protein
MPSATVLKKSERSRRIFRLSAMRVSPPVPGSTPSSGTSGNDTALLRSSTSRILSHASASSYPPPDAVPLRAARKRRPEFALASSMPRRVSFVNLQKFTLKPCVDVRSITMFAPAQNTRSSAPVSTTQRTSGCSKRSRCTKSASSRSTPRS